MITVSDVEWSVHQVDAFVDAQLTAAVQYSNLVAAPHWEARQWLSFETQERFEREARAFLAAHASDLAWLSPDQAGYDLWMTRNQVGTGYWARYLPNDPGDMFHVRALSGRRDAATVAAFDAAMARLSEAARALGELDVYLGDDGELHV